MEGQQKGVGAKMTSGSAFQGIEQEGLQPKARIGDRG
jgi:hypothetical protein